MIHRFASTARRGVLAAAAALLVTGLVPPAAVRAADGLTSITVGALPVDTSATIFYAQDQGFFKAHGLDVKIVTMPSGPVIATAVSANSLDIGVANAATVASAYTRGIALRFIAPAAIATPKTRTDVIMVAKDSKIASAADLNGKTVALNGLKDLQQICAMSWIDRHGGDSKTVKFVEVPFPQMGGALEAHRVDAALPVEPFATTAKASGRVIGDVLDGLAPNFMIVGWLANDSWLKTHADVATRFVAAIREASVWANAHEKESAQILLKNSKLDPSVAETMARAIYGTELDGKLIQPVLNGAIKYGVIDKPVTPADLIWTAPKR